MKRILIAALTAMTMIPAFAGHDDHKSETTVSGRIDNIQEAVAAVTDARIRLEQSVEKKETVKAAGAARDAAKAAEEASRFSDEVNVKSKKAVRSHAAAIKEDAIKVLRAAEQEDSNAVKEHAAAVIKQADALQELVTGKKTAAKGAKASAQSDKEETAAADLKELGNPDCPISGHPVGSMQAGSHIKYGGYKIGLCCDSCQAAFLKEPKKFLKAAMEQKK